MPTAQSTRTASDTWQVACSAPGPPCDSADPGASHSASKTDKAPVRLAHYPAALSPRGTQGRRRGEADLTRTESVYEKTQIFHSSSFLCKLFFKLFIHNDFYFRILYIQ